MYACACVCTRNEECCGEELTGEELQSARQRECCGGSKLSILAEAPLFVNV